MICFVWTFNLYANVVGLLLRQGRELHTDTLQMQTSHLLVEVLRQAVNTDLVRLLPEIHLCQNLIGERVTHHERGVSCGAT